MHVSDSVGHERAEMKDKETFVSSDCCHSCFFITRLKQLSLVTNSWQIPTKLYIQLHLTNFLYLIILINDHSYLQEWNHRNG